MRRLTAYFVFMSCFMLILVGLPRLADAIWGGKSLAGALVFMSFPLWLGIVYLFATRPQIKRAEQAPPETLATYTSAGSLPKWIQAILPYNTWFMSFTGLSGGIERFVSVSTPFWFRLIFLVCAVGCGVLGFFLGWEDVRNHRKRQKALCELEAQSIVAEDSRPVATATIHTSKSEALPLRRS